MEKVTISFVTENSDDNISIESDKDRNTDISGKVKTKFRYGDKAYFRIYAHQPETIEVFSTDGTISSEGLFIDSHQEIIPFISENTAQTEKHITSVTSADWLGNGLGAVSKADVYSVSSEVAPNPSEGSVALLRLDYKTSYALFGLTLLKKESDEYPVMVYVRRKDV
jgi:hypothetical protein